MKHISLRPVRNRLIVMIVLMVVLLSSSTAGRVSAYQSDPSGVAQIRFSALAADAPAADLYIDNALLAKNIRYGLVSDFYSLPAGKHSLTLVPTGDTPDKPSLAQTEIEPTSGTKYMVAMLGGTAGTLQFVVINESEAITKAAMVGEGVVPLLFLDADTSGQKVDLTFDTGKIQTQIKSRQSGKFLGLVVPRGRTTLRITVTDQPQTKVLETTVIGIPNTYTFATLVSDKTHYSLLSVGVSPLTTEEYLTLLNTMPDSAAYGGTYKTFLSLMQAGGLGAAFNRPQNDLTIFVPTDQAFESWGTAEQRSKLSGEKQAILDLFSNHSVDGLVSTADFLSGQHVTTLGNSSIALQGTVDKLTLNGKVTVLTQETRLANGITVYGVDKILALAQK